MNFDKRISRLLAKSLLVPLSISCFSFCCVSAMEGENENKKTGKKFIGNKHLSTQEQELKKVLEMLDRAKKIKKEFETINKQDERKEVKEKRQRKDKPKTVNQCIRKAISSQGSDTHTMIARYRSADFEDKSRFFAQNITPVNVKTISNIIQNLRELNETNPLAKESPAYLLLDTVEDIEKIIPKSSLLPHETTGDKLTDEQLELLNNLLSDEQFNLFNKYFESIINSFFGAYKTKTQNNTAESLLKTLNIWSSGKWADAHPEGAKSRAKKCIYDAIWLLKQKSQESIINLKEEEKK